MRQWLLIVGLVMVFALPALAQKEDPVDPSAVQCDALAYLEEITADIETYVTLSSTEGLDNAGNMLAVYSQLMQARRKYEDTRVCADLATVQLITLELFSTMQDLIVYSGTVPNAIRTDPANAAQYATELGILSERLTAVSTALTDEISLLSAGN